MTRDKERTMLAIYNELYIDYKKLLRRRNPSEFLIELTRKQLKILQRIMLHDLKMKVEFKPL